MIEDFIKNFKKINVDRKIFLLYLCLYMVPIAIIMRLLPNAYYFLAIMLVSLAIILIILYLYICKYNNDKIFNKKTLKVLYNVIKFEMKKTKAYSEYIERFILDNGLYSENKLIFLINHFNNRYTKRQQRDWLIIVITLIISIIPATISINEGEVDIANFLAQLIIITYIIILIVIIYFVIILFRKISNLQLLTKRAVYKYFENRFTDIYLSKKMKKAIQ